MPKNQSRKSKDFSAYHDMSTEELEQLLRLDNDAHEGNELDADTILHILGVLDERKNHVSSTGKSSQQAWESFQQNYLSAEDDSESMHIVTKNRKKLNPKIRRLIAAAAVIAVLILVPFTANALGAWNYIAKWTKDTFMFVREDPPEPSEFITVHDTELYSSLQEALIDSYKETDSVPTWIPEGFTLQSIDINENPIYQKYLAYYTNGDKFIHIVINFNENAPPTPIEKSGDWIEIYTVNDIEYYIFYNNDSLVAAWVYNDCENMIAGDLTLDEMKQMINSIGKGD